MSESASYYSYKEYCRLRLAGSGFWIRTKSGKWRTTRDPEVIKEKLSRLKPDDRRAVQAMAKDSRKRKEFLQEQIRALITALSKEEIKRISEEIADIDYERSNRT